MLRIETSGGAIADCSTLMIRDDGQALNRQIEINNGVLYLSLVIVINVNLKFDSEKTISACKMAS